MSDQDPESTPFFKVVMVTIGIAAVVLFSPIADRITEHRVAAEREATQIKTMEVSDGR